MVSGCNICKCVKHKVCAWLCLIFVAFSSHYALTIWFIHSGNVCLAFCWNMPWLTLVFSSAFVMCYSFVFLYVVCVYVCFDFSLCRLEVFGCQFLTPSCLQMVYEVIYFPIAIKHIYLVLKWQEISYHVLTTVWHLLCFYVTLYMSSYFCCTVYNNQMCPGLQHLNIGRVPKVSMHSLTAMTLQLKCLISLNLTGLQVVSWTLRYSIHYHASVMWTLTQELIVLHSWMIPQWTLWSTTVSNFRVWPSVRVLESLTWRCTASANAHLTSGTYKHFILFEHIH